MKKLKIGKSQIHGRGLFSGESIKKGELIAKVHSGIQMDPETIKYMPTQFGRFYNHDEKGFNSKNEIIGNHRYLRAIKAIPANTEITANYREHSEMEQPEDFGSGKYASFDFDKTIATEEGLAKARQMLRDGYNLFIVSARDKVTPDMVARARQAGIPEENIIATGSDNAKVRKVKQLGVEKHFDDKPEVIAALGSVGEQFKKGGGVNSKKYTRSIFGKNKLFVKNNLFKTKKVKNRIYDPNAKYFDNGGIIENNPDAPWNPDYPQPTTYEFQTLSPEEIAVRNKFQQECTEDQPCYETDQIQAYLNQGMDFPRKNVGLMWDVVDDVNNPNSKYYHNAKAKWKQMGLPQTLGQRLNMNDPSNCMWAAGSGWQCLSDTKDEFKTLPLSAFESNDKFINAVNKGTVPFERVAKITKDRYFDDQSKGILRTGDIINLKSPDVSHAITFSHYREDGVPIYLDSNGSPMNFDWNEGIYTNIKPGNGVTAYISRFSPEKFYQDKIDILEEKARTNPTYYKDGGSSFGPPEEFYKNWYQNRVMPTPEGQKLLEKIRPEALERASQSVPYIYSEELNPDEAGYYDTETQQILLNKFLPEAQIEATKQHEFGHHIQAGDKFYDVLGKPHQYLVEQNIIGPKEINTGNPEWDKNLKKNYDDITNPDEIHARIMTLRNECGFKPDQVITEKDIEDCFKRKKEAGEALDPDIEDLKGVTKGNQSIVNLLNDMVSVPSNRQDLQFGKYGLELDLTEDEIQKYVDGGYVVEDISIPSLTRMDDGGTNTCPPDHYWNGEACVPTGRTLTPIDPNYIAEHPDEATYVINEAEVEVNPPKERVPLMMQFSNEFQENNPYDAYYEKAAYDYLKKSKKNWDDALGINIHNLPENVAKRIQNNYYKDLEKYVINKSKETKKGYQGRFDKKGNWQPLFGKKNILDPSLKRPAGHGSWDNYGDGSIQMVYPEQFFMGPGAGILGLTGRAAAKGISNLAKSSLVQGTKAALSQPIANIPGLTVGNAIASGFAADAVVNRFPKVPSQIAEGNYSGALENALTGTLDIAGANMMSPLLKGIGKGIAATPETLSNLAKFVKTEGSPKLKQFFDRPPGPLMIGLGSGTKSTKQAPLFKSEIDWVDWVKKHNKNYDAEDIQNIIRNSEEYNVIEQQTKANGTWMKNADGSPFQGTPEQFIQSQSTKFKQAYPEGTEITYRGGDKRDAVKSDWSDKSNVVFTTKDEFGARTYNRSLDQPPLSLTEAPPEGVSQLYMPKTSNKIVIDGNEYPVGHKYRSHGLPYVNDAGKVVYSSGSRTNYARLNAIDQVPANELEAKNLEAFKTWMLETHPTMTERGWRGEPRILNDWVMTDHFAGFLNSPAGRNIDRVEFQKIMDGTLEPIDVEVHNLNKAQQLKSMWGNSGEFDLTNPSKFKALLPYLIPTGLGVGAASQMQSQESNEGYSKGGTYKLGDEVDDATMKQLKKLGYTFEKI